MDKRFYGIVERPWLQKTLTLLDKNVEYYENPIDAPCKSFDDVIYL